MTFSEEELSDLVSAKSRYPVFQTAKDTEVRPSAQSKIVSAVCSKSIVYVTETSGQNSKIQTFFWLWSNSARRQGETVIANMDESMRATANGVIVGQLRKDTAVELLHTNEKRTWHLVALSGWVQSSDLIEYEPVDMLTWITPIEPVRILPTSRAAGVVRYGLSGLAEYFTSLVLISLIYLSLALRRLQHRRAALDRR